MKLNLYISFLLSFVPLFSWGQILSVSPAFPTVNDTVTIIYDATQGNAALTGVSPVYMHTGVITNLSATPASWLHVVTTWAATTGNCIMTSLGNNKHQVKFHIKTFYGITNPNETVQKMAFVFRNGTGSIVGKTASNGDIFYDVYSGSSVNINIAAPQNGTIYSINDPIAVSANASSASDLSLYLNNALVQSATAATQITYNTQGTVAGQYWLKLVANTAGSITTDSIYYIVQGAPVVQSPPTGTPFGVQYLSATSVRVTLSTPYPDKSWIYLIGDFNNWLPTPATQMKKRGDGRVWWVDITGLTPGQEYAFQFLVKNNSGTLIKVTDPYADKLLDPWNDSYIPLSIYPNPKPYPVGKTTGLVSVFQTQQTPYNWQVSNFTRPAKTDLVVYELLVRDWSKRHAYQAILDSLWYLKNMGINSIELMPIMEFDGNESWGYGPNHQLAVDKYYGDKNKLKELIDVCHQNGIAVLLDIALNHQFGLSPMVNLYWDATNNKPAATNPWFNPDAKHDFNVGYDMNHDNPDTRIYVDSVLRYWVREYKVDGFRFDLSKGFTQNNTLGNVGLWGQYDASRVYNLKRMADQIWAVDPSSLLILEHFADNSEEKVLADYGFMLWGNLNYAYNQATMGYSTGWDLTGISHKSRNFNNAHLVGYMESHDEERLMFKNLAFGNISGSYNIKTLNTALDRQALAAAFFLTVPGPKMIWQFGELGYDISIDNPCRTCNKPVLWNYYNVAARNHLYQIYAALTKLRITEAAFETSNFTTNLGGTTKQIALTHSSMNVNVIGNFDVVANNNSFTFQNTGKWYDYFSGDSITITTTSPTISLQPGEYRIYTSKKLATPSLNVNIDKGANNFFVSVFPNPFSEEIHILYALPKATKANIRIYDLMGKLVKEMENTDNVPAFDMQEMIWDGRDDQGNRTAAGTYIYQISADAAMQTGKIVKGE